MFPVWDEMAKQDGLNQGFSCARREPALGDNRSLLRLINKLKPRLYPSRTASRFPSRSDQIAHSRASYHDRAATKRTPNLPHLPLNEAQSPQIQNLTQFLNHLHDRRRDPPISLSIAICLDNTFPPRKLTSPSTRAEFFRPPQEVPLPQLLISLAGAKKGSYPRTINYRLETNQIKFAQLHPLK